MSDTKRLAVAIAELAAATAGKELDEAVLAVYVKHLSKHDPAAVLAQLERLTTSAKFFPSLGEILEGIRGNPQVRAAEAWARLDMKDPVTAECVRLIGGQRAIGQCATDKMHFLERRFCELFPNVETRVMAEQASRPDQPFFEPAPRREAIPRERWAWCSPCNTTHDPREGCPRVRRGEKLLGLDS